jgi:hypothetical protein
VFFEPLICRLANALVHHKSELGTGGVRRWTSVVQQWTCPLAFTCENYILFRNSSFPEWDDSGFYARPRCCKSTLIAVFKAIVFAEPVRPTYPPVGECLHWLLYCSVTFAALNQRAPDLSFCLSQFRRNGVNNILRLQKLLPLATGMTDGEPMLMSTASGLCLTGQVDEASPFHLE